MSESTQNPVQDIPLDRIRPSQLSLRPLNEATVTEIATSMQQQGQLSPILVRPIGDGEYELVFGSHRLAAARQLQLATIRCEIQHLTRDRAMIAALSENMARNEFIDPIAEGRTYDTLTHLGYTQTLIAREIGRTQQYVSGRMNLLRLEPEIQTLITSGLVSAEHGIELSRLEPRTRGVLAQLSRKDSQNPLRLEELRHLAGLSWDELASDPRVEPLLATDPIEQIRRLRTLCQQLETRFQELETRDVQTQAEINAIRERLEKNEETVTELYVNAEDLARSFDKLVKVLVTR